MATKSGKPLPKDQQEILAALRKAEEVIGERCKMYTAKQRESKDDQVTRDYGRKGVSAENDGKALKRVIDRVAEGFYAE